MWGGLCVGEIGVQNTWQMFVDGRPPLSSPLGVVLVDGKEGDLAGSLSGDDPSKGPALSACHTISFLLFSQIFVLR